MLMANSDSGILSVPYIGMPIINIIDKLISSQIIEAVILINKFDK